MAKIVHCSDLHLGKTQLGIPERKEDFFSAFLEIAGGCIRRDVDALVVTGDIFERENPSDETIDEAIEVINHLNNDEALCPDIPVYLVHGDHDSPPGERKTPGVDRLVEETHAERLGSYPTKVSEGAVLYGVHNEDIQRLVEGNLSFVEPTQDTNVFLCTHVMFNKHNTFVRKSESYSPSEILDAVPFEIDILLCGEMHKSKDYTASGTPVRFPGAPARIDKSKRDYQPGVYLFKTGDEGIESERYQVPTRPWENVEIEIGPEDSINTTLEKVYQALDIEPNDDKIMLDVTLSQRPAQFSLSELRDELEDWSGSLSVAVKHKLETGNYVGTGHW